MVNIFTETLHRKERRQIFMDKCSVFLFKKGIYLLTWKYTTVVWRREDIFCWSTHEQGWNETECQLLHLVGFYWLRVGGLFTIKVPDLWRTVCRHTTVLPTVFQRNVDVSFSLMLPESGRAVGWVELRRLHGLCTECHLRHDRPTWVRFPGKAAVSLNNKECFRTFA